MPDTNKERVRRHRERHDLTAFSVDIPKPLRAEIDAYCISNGVTQAEFLARATAALHADETKAAAIAGASGQLHWINEEDVTPTVWAYIEGARGYLAASGTETT